MKRLMAVLLFGLLSLGAQKKEIPPQEQEDLQDAIAESGNSPVEFMRNLERYLKRYPDSAKKADIERGIARAAMDLKDHRRVALYGERVLAREPEDATLLEAVSRALLANDDKGSAEKALKYSRRLEPVLRKTAGEEENSRSRARLVEEREQRLAKAYVYQARALGNLGKFEEAIALAGQSYQVSPTAEAAREKARWLERAGRNEDAILVLADALTIADPRSTDAVRSKDRERLGELYRSARGNEKGLGDLILEAYDRTSSVLAGRKNKLRETDPNAGATEPMEFTLSSLKGEKLNLATLKGKVIVMDFWATWCGPCRAQRPLYDQVKKRFANEKDVLFLAVNTDEDRALVEPFLEANKWSKSTYFEDGLSLAMRISSIPTTVVFNRRGEVVSRMSGVIMDRFVDMLSERIKEALVD
jgi:thiol-disulfide isomerase/thioredoxin